MKLTLGEYRQLWFTGKVFYDGVTRRLRGTDTVLEVDFGQASTAREDEVREDVEETRIPGVFPWDDGTI